MVYSQAWECSYKLNDQPVREGLQLVQIFQQTQHLTMWVCLLDLKFILFLNWIIFFQTWKCHMGAHAVQSPLIYLKNTLALGEFNLLHILSIKQVMHKSYFTSLWLCTTALLYCLNLHFSSLIGRDARHSQPHQARTTLPFYLLA